MTTNKQALREVAEKATPGKWWIDSHGQAMVSFFDNDVLEVFATDNKRAAVRHEDTGNLSRWRNDNDATFIASANPANVLALLDELEADELQIKTLESRNRRLEGIIEAAEKRIAELEVREIREEGNQFLVVRHPGKAPVIKHAVGELDAYLRQLNEQDPLVTVDIITHRYYGVGGQFVQDGDEYLATAGITTKGE